MGGKSSKLLSSNSRASEETVTLDQVSQRIEEMQQLFEQVNKNDSTVLLNMLNSPQNTSGIKMNAEVKKHVVDLLQQVEKTGSADQPPEFKQFVNFMTDADRKVMETHLSVFDDEAKGKVRSALSPFFALNAKYRFFMYKYIQLNLFVIMYTKKTQQVMNDVSLQIRSSYQVQHEKDNEMLAKFVSLVQNFAGLKDGDITMEQQHDIINIGNQALQTVKTENEALQNKLKEFETAKTMDIVKMLVNSNEDIRKQVEEFMKTPKQSTSFKQ